MKNSKTKRKQEWNKPVSQKFYAGIQEFIIQCLDEMKLKRGWLEHVMTIIDNYLDDGSRPSFYVEPLVRNMFIMMRRDIDRAVSRSAMARRRAAERREAKAREAAKMENKEQKNRSSIASTAVSAAEMMAASATDGIGKERAVEQRASEGNLVGILDFVADGNSAGKLGDSDIAKGRQTAVEIKVGGLPLHSGA